MESNSEPLISIVLTIYNSEKIIEIHLVEKLLIQVICCFS
jgi:hypothetical protein